MGHKCQFHDDTSCSSLAFLFPVSWAVSVKCKEMPICQAESGSCGNEVMSPVSSWFCLVVEGLASEVRGGQKQFKLFEDSAKHSELLIPDLIFYCSGVQSFWDLVVAAEEFISLYSWVKKKCFGGGLTWMQLCIRVLSCWGSQLAVKRNHGHAACAAQPWHGMCHCSARVAASYSQEWLSKARKEAQNDGPLLWAKSDQFLLYFLLVHTSKCIS